MALKNIILLGIGGVGWHLAKRLVHEGHSVTVIESDPNIIAYASEQLDARIVTGSAMESSKWEEAHAEKADLLIAVTDNDALNMLSALIADKFKIPQKIARVRSLDFGEGAPLLSAESLKIDLMIHPEELVAQEIVKLIQRSAGNDLIDIGQGQMKVLAFNVNENSPFVNKTVEEISLLHSKVPFKVVAIARGITTIITSGEQVVLPNDHLFIFASSEDIYRLMKIIGIQHQSLHRLMILGGGLVGKRVAELLEKTMKVSIIENNEQYAEELALSLSRTQVLHGDGTDANVLIMGGLTEMDSFIATTGDNETNIISCLLAKHLMNKRNREEYGSVGKTIALVNKEDYMVLASTIGLDIALNTKISAANEIFKFIGRSELLSVAHLHGVDAEVVEVVAAPRSWVTRKPLRKLMPGLADGILLGGLVRENIWSITTPDTHIQEGDRVIVICASQALKDVRKLFN
ncbi:Trk system potassium transporter TrkA [Deltaproteobacteria bacterium TL4]